MSSAACRPPSPSYPTRLRSKAVAAGYTSTRSGTWGTVLLCRPDWRREGIGRLNWSRLARTSHVLTEPWVSRSAADVKAFWFVRNRVNVCSAVTRVTPGRGFQSCAPEKVNMLKVICVEMFVLSAVCFNGGFKDTSRRTCHSGHNQQVETNRKRFGSQWVTLAGEMRNFQIFHISKFLIWF